MINDRFKRRRLLRKVRYLIRAAMSTLSAVGHTARLGGMQHDTVGGVDDEKSN